MKMPKLLRDTLTENDGTTYCPVRVAGAALTSLGIPTFIGGAAWSAHAAHQFALMPFAQAFATMMGGVALLGGGVAAKALTDGRPGSQSGGQS